MWHVRPDASRDDYRNIVRGYLKAQMCKPPFTLFTGNCCSPYPAQLVPNATFRWKAWWQQCWQHKLVLQGWGDDTFPRAPGGNWADRIKHSLIASHWQALVEGIPPDYFGNPLFNLPEGRLPLKIVALDDYLRDHPGMLLFLYSLPQLLIL